MENNINPCWNQLPGSKYEWRLYQNFKNGKLSHVAYENQLRDMNPMLAFRKALFFQWTFERIISEIRKEINLPRLSISYQVSFQGCGTMIEGNWF